MKQLLPDIFKKYLYGLFYNLDLSRSEDLILLHFEIKVNGTVRFLAIPFKNVDFEQL